MSHTLVNLTRTLAGAALALTLGAAQALAGDEAQVQRGKDVYTAQKCQICHAIAGKGNKMNPLDSVGKKLSLEDTKKWIISPIEMAAQVKSTKKPPMPAKYGKLPPADVDALVAYMQSLK